MALLPISLLSLVSSRRRPGSNFLRSKYVRLPANTDAGGGPAAAHFLCSAKESKQRKAAPSSPPLRGSLRYSVLKAAAELVGRMFISAPTIAVAPSSDSPRRLPLQPLRCSAARTGPSAERAAPPSLERQQSNSQIRHAA